MIQPTTVSTRDIVRNAKRIFGTVRRTKQPAIITNLNEPQVAIVSLEDLEKLQQFKDKNSGKALLDIVKEVNALLRDENLPPDLSENHDYYLWGGKKKRPG